ncbi:beta-glucosidase family protein [Demequina maris]|uniref:beta-glucosidase family protein n=1 Tax=Demequina maris TaxID=1638982 RepID=UPI0007808345|nr:glycoside hydrolase family 3 C-terminal domain-containing protein [Demequina maris]
MATAHEPFVEAALSRLSLEEKVLLLTGRDSWSLHGIESIGLRPMVMSDGPAGVRGDTWDERSPSVNFPSPTAVAASWDPELVREVGNGLGAEARRKNVDVVLAPTINIQRSPYGGRHFEAFSEDPLLTSTIATAYVAGIQDHGVGATVKHYVANDAETERFTASSDVDERTLREVYLAAFEGPVTEGDAWLVMSAYNAINGTTASEHELLRTPLKDEWGFDGVVVSDWTAVRSLDSARAAQDLAMPGPASPWGDALVAAVRRGDIAEEIVDDKVRRILRLAARVGALEGAPEPARIAAPAAEATVATAREASEAGMVLLSNDGILPLDTPRSIAVIGEGARDARTQGGGSATVIPATVSSPLDGIAARWPEAAVSWSRGAVVQSGLADIPVDRLRTPSGEPGMRVRYLDGDGGVLDEETRTASRVVSFDAESKALRAATVELAFTYSPEAPGDKVPFGVAGLSDYRVLVNGAEAARGSLRTRPGDDPATAVLNPPFEEIELPANGGPLEIVVEISPVEGGIPDSIALGVGLPPVRAAARELIAEAARAAAAADVAVVVVSTSNEVESEGFDRTSLALPGAQDALVAAVTAANPRTVVVVNSGSPVLLPWRGSAAAAIAAWFPGQEFGTALAAVLGGDAEPGGRLPVTWPADEASVPVAQVAPVDGHLAYTEGVHVGHRAWLRSGARPAFPFGHGLGYTSWEVDEVTVAGDALAGDATARVRVRNTGDRRGKVVVQLYLEAPADADDMPMRWHAGFAVARLDGGAEALLSVPLPARRFQRWQDGWCAVPGTFRLHAGLSAEDLRAGADIAVPVDVVETV